MGLHLSFSSPLLSLPPSLPPLSFFPPFSSSLLLTNNPRQPFEEDCWGTPPPTSSHRALNLPQRHFLLFCRIVGVNLASSTRRSFHEFFLFILFNFCHTTRTFVSVDWILCVDESSNYFHRSWGFRAVQLSNHSARKGSDNCLVPSLLFLLSSSVPSGWLYTSIPLLPFHPSPLLSFLFFSFFLFNGC